MVTNDNKLETVCKETVVTLFVIPFRHLNEKLRKTTNNLSHGWPLNSGLNLRLPEYGVRLLSDRDVFSRAQFSGVGVDAARYSRAGLMVGVTRYLNPLQRSRTALLKYSLSQN